MQKDNPVLIMTIMFLIMIGVIMISGMVENARYSDVKQTAVDKNNTVHVTGG